MYYLCIRLQINMSVLFCSAEGERKMKRRYKGEEGKK